MFFMAFNRGARLAALEFVDKAGPMQPITHWYIEHTALDKVNHFASSSSVDAIDQIFFFELKKMTQGISLPNADVVNARCVELVTEPLWLGINEPASTKAGEELFSLLSNQSPGTWDYWEKWYRSLLPGNHLDMNLQKAVLSIENDVWERGAEAIAAEIAKITDKHITEKLPQAEVIFETESGEYDVKTAIADPSKLTTSVLSRASFAYDMALESNACDLNAMSTPAKILRHVFENCADDPNAIEQFFRQASDMIKRKIEEGQFAVDDELEVLTCTLDESALQMRADHPEVGEAADKRLKQTLREIDDAKRLEIAASIDAMVEGSTGRLATEFELSAETTRSDSGTAAQASAIKMSSERAAKISIAERTKKAEGSGILSGVKIGMRGRSLVELVFRLMSSGG